MFQDNQQINVQINDFYDNYESETSITLCLSGIDKPFAIFQGEKWLIHEFEDLEERGYCFTLWDDNGDRKFAYYTEHLEIYEQEVE
jgi:hypothetical protein